MTPETIAERLPAAGNEEYSHAHIMAEADEETRSTVAEESVFDFACVLLADLARHLRS